MLVGGRLLLMLLVVVYFWLVLVSVCFGSCGLVVCC